MALCPLAVQNTIYRNRLQTSLATESPSMYVVFLFESIIIGYNEIFDINDIIII